MTAARGLWRRVGALSALTVVGSVLGVAIAARIALGAPARDVVAGALLGLLIVHCLARPRDGWTVFGAACMPGAAATIASSVVGVDKWPVALLFLPLALFAARDVDRRVVPVGSPGAASR